MNLLYAIFPVLDILTLEFRICFEFPVVSLVASSADLLIWIDSRRWALVNTWAAFWVWKVSWIIRKVQDWAAPILGKGWGNADCLNIKSRAACLRWFGFFVWKRSLHSSFPIIAHRFNPDRRRFARLDLLNFGHWNLFRISYFSMSFDSHRIGRTFSGPPLEVAV